MKLEKKLFKKIKFFSEEKSDNTSDHHLIHPIRAWLTCLGLSVVFTCIVSVYIGLTFYTGHTDITIETSPAVEFPTYHSSDAERLITIYSERKKTFDSLHEGIQEALPPTQSVAPVEEEVPLPEPLAEDEAAQYTDPGNNLVPILQ